MNSNVAYVIGVIVILVIAGIGISSYTGYVAEQPGNYDILAQCLTDKGAVLYGAYWCHNCETQKQLFGSSFEHIDYVECAVGDPEGKAQSELCLEKGIRAYPTWIIDGREIVGVQSLEKLSDITGCQLSE